MSQDASSRHVTALAINLKSSQGAPVSSHKSVQSSHRRVVRPKPYQSFFISRIKGNGEEGRDISRAASTRFREGPKVGPGTFYIFIILIFPFTNETKKEKYHCYIRRSKPFRTHYSFPVKSRVQGTRDKSRCRISLLRNHRSYRYSLLTSPRVRCSNISRHVVSALENQSRMQFQTVSKLFF